MNTFKKGFLTFLIAVIAVCISAFAGLALTPANTAFADGESEATPRETTRIDINTAFEWQGVTSENGVADADAVPFDLLSGQIFVYSLSSDPTAITTRRYSLTTLNDDDIRANYSLTGTVNANNSAAENRGREITVGIKVNPAYESVISVKYDELTFNGEPVTPGVNYSDTMGLHQACALITLTGDYEFYNNDTSSSGIIISNDNKSAFINKEWYIVEASNPLVEAQEESSGIEPAPWSVNGWTYNTEAEIPAAPALTYGDAQTEVTFSLTNSVGTIDFNEVSLADFGDYVNGSMPAGTYSLVFDVPQVKIDGIVHSGYTQTYTLVISPAEFLAEWRTDITSKLNGNDAIEYRAIKNSEGQYEFQLYGNDADLAVWEYFETRQFNPERTGVWAGEDYNNFYSDGYELTYNLDRQANNVYQNYAAMQSVGTPAAPDTYTVYYQLEANNYESLTNIMNESERRTYTFSLVIYDVIDLPERELPFTGGEQLIAATNRYTVVKTDTSDTYTERGEHTVKLVSTDSEHYRFLDGDNAVSEVLFTYTISRVDNQTEKFQFSGWEWDGYDSSKLPIWTTLYEDENDPDFYTYYIVSDDDSHTRYEQDQFYDAPMGSYTIYCTAKGFVLSDAENTADYSYNTLTYEYHFNISKASNTWVITPDVIQWQFNGFDAATHRFLAEATHSAADDPVLFSVATDENGAHVVEGLANFTTDADNKITDEEIIKNLNKLEAGTYYLISVLNGTDNYYGLEPQPHRFEVLVADNSWTKAPGIETWITGKYDPATNAIAGEARFGTVRCRIVSADDEEKVIYDDALGINELADADVGSYILTVTVDDDVNGNFKGISEFIQFRIFEKPGLPWWATVIIVVAALGVAALVLYILHQKGILQLLSGKIVVAMRTKATVDATIAAVRANKVAADARKSVATARLQEANAARRRKQEELKNMTLEEQAAALEQQAREAAEKAEKLDKKATRTQKRAEKLKKQAEAEQSATADDVSGGNDENPDNTAE